MSQRYWPVLVFCGFSTLASAQTVLKGAYVTPGAVSDQQRLCPPASEPYPPQWTWTGAVTPPPRGALPSDNLTPRIEQHRMMNGADAIVAVWGSFSSGPNCQEIFRSSNSGPFAPAQLQQMAASGCGPFGNTSHVDLFRLWAPGDTFLVYPAVYTGTNNNIVMHAQPDYYTGGPVPIYAPNDITIKGVVRNGIRPILYRNDGGAGDSETTKDAVEIQNGYGDTIANLDVQLGPNGSLMQSLVYLIGAGTAYYDANGNPLATPLTGGVTTLSRMRVSYAELQEAASGGANGIFGDTTGGGVLDLDRLEVDHDGGSGPQNGSGPGHGIYVGGSTLDPAYTVRLRTSYFHDNYYGHDAKFRAPRQIVRGNYFQGGLPQGGIYAQAETFNLDIPNGGALIAQDNIFVKTMSGANSNGFGLAYGEEGIPDGRPLSIRIDHNTFVTFSATWDGSHPTIPLFFFYPAQEPGTSGFPVAANATAIRYNAYVGYCPTGNAVSDYRGSTALIAGFGDLNQAFSFGGLWASYNASVIGHRAYGHVDLLLRRALASIGAED